MPSTMAGIPSNFDTPRNHHPVEEIAESVQHRLLLKQWMRQEEAISGIIAFKESMLDSVRKETMKLFCVFFLYHGLTLIFLSSFFEIWPVYDHSCKMGWIFGLHSVLVSFAMILGIRYTMGMQREAGRVLEREKKDVRVLSMCIEGLKSKGKRFDLLDAVYTLRRARGFWVTPQGKGKGWTSKDLTTLLLILASGLVLGLTHWLVCHSGDIGSEEVTLGMR